MALSKLAFLHFGGGASDPIQVLVDEYKAYVIGLSNGVIVDETEVYNAINAAVTAGEVTSAGVNTKEAYHIGYKFGMVKDPATQTISKMISLFKVGGVYPEFSQATGDAKPIWTADYINMFDGTFGKSMVLQNNLAYAKDSFYVQVKSLKQYISGVAYVESSTPTTEGFRQGVHSTGRFLSLTYNVVGSVNATSNNNYFLNDYHTYKSIYTRTGDTLSLELLRDGTSFQTFADRTWDRNLVVAVQLIGGSISTHNFREYKMAKL